MRGFGPRAVTVLGLATVFAVSLSTTARADTHRVSFRRGVGQTRTFFEHGGLKLIGECNAGPDLQVFARNTYDGAADVHMNSQATGPADYYAGGDDFGPGAANQIDVFDTSDGIVRDDGSSGQIVYSRPGGVNVTVDFLAEESPTALGADCEFAGIARVVRSGESGYVSFKQTTAASGDPYTTFFNQGGLKLQGRCDVDPASPDLDVIAKSSYENASVHFNSQSPVDQNAYGELDDLDPSESQDLLAVLPDDAAAGQIIYAAPGSSIVTVDWAAEEQDWASGARDCAFVGAARAAAPGSSHRVNFRADMGVVTPNFFDSGTGDLLLDGTCDISGNLDATAHKSGASEGIIHYNSQGPSNAVPYAENNNFTSGTVGVTDDVGSDNRAGQIIYVGDDSDRIVTMNFLAEDNSGSEMPFGGTKSCGFVGTVENIRPGH